MQRAASEYQQIYSRSRLYIDWYKEKAYFTLRPTLPIAANHQPPNLKWSHAGPRADGLAGGRVVDARRQLGDEAQRDQLRRTEDQEDPVRQPAGSG